jgi:hypothetical protein
MILVEARRILQPFLGDVQNQMPVFAIDGQ